MRPIIRRGIIDLVYLAAGIFTENVNKTGKMAKNRFLADFVDFIVQPCYTPHSKHNRLLNALDADFLPGMSKNRFTRRLKSENRQI